MVEEPLAADTAGTMIIGVVVTAMRTVTRGEMIEWIGGAARGMTIAGMTAGGMIEVCSVFAQKQRNEELLALLSLFVVYCCRLFCSPLFLVVF